MKITLEPTEEFYKAPINGVEIPVRIWAGVTEGGIPIEAYVLSITPNNKDDSPKLKAELPFFMVPSRKLFQIGRFKKDTKEI